LSRTRTRETTPHGFTVDPAAAPTGEPPSTDLAWLIPAAATALLLPAALLARRRRARR
jgi:hypothetical protein